LVEHRRGRRVDQRSQQRIANHRLIAFRYRNEFWEPGRPRSARPHGKSPPPPRDSRASPHRSAPR
jgi:hypothetical protein